MSQVVNLLQHIAPKKKKKIRKQNKESGNIFFYLMRFLTVYLTVGQKSFFGKLEIRNTSAIHYTSSLNQQQKVIENEKKKITYFGLTSKKSLKIVTKKLYPKSFRDTTTAKKQHLDMVSADFNFDVQQG